MTQIDAKLMKADLVRGWLLKAESDLTTASLCITANQALDTACWIGSLPIMNQTENLS